MIKRIIKWIQRKRLLRRLKKEVDELPEKMKYQNIRDGPDVNDN